MQGLVSSIIQTRWPVYRMVSDGKLCQTVIQALDALLQPSTAKQHWHMLVVLHTACNDQYCSGCVFLHKILHYPKKN